MFEVINVFNMLALLMIVTVVIADKPECVLEVLQSASTGCSDDPKDVKAIYANFLRILKNLGVVTEHGQYRTPETENQLVLINFIKTLDKCLEEAEDDDKTEECFQRAGQQLIREYSC